MLVACDRILIIAGDSEHAAIPGRILESAGYRVSYAHRLRVALHILESLQPDLILVTTSVWNFSRKQAVDSLRKHFIPEHEPCVLIVRRSKEYDSAEADAWLPEDFTKTELLDTVRSLLRTKRQMVNCSKDLEDLRRGYLELKQRCAQMQMKSRYLGTDLSRIEKEACAETALSENMLDDRRRAVSELAGAVNHELNQPLTVIIGRIQLMKRTLPASSDLTGTIQVIEDQARRMADIVQKIGRIHEYATKPYPGGRSIIDIDKASS